MQVQDLRDPTLFRGGTKKDNYFTKAEAEVQVLVYVLTPTQGAGCMTEIQAKESLSYPPWRALLAIPKR